MTEQRGAHQRATRLLSCTGCPQAFTNVAARHVHTYTRTAARVRKALRFLSQRSGSLATRGRRTKCGVRTSDG